VVVAPFPFPLEVRYAVVAVTLVVPCAVMLGTLAQDEVEPVAVVESAVPEPLTALTLYEWLVPQVRPVCAYTDVTPERVPKLVPLAPGTQLAPLHHRRL